MGAVTDYDMLIHAGRHVVSLAQVSCALISMDKGLKILCPYIIFLSGFIVFDGGDGENSYVICLQPKFHL